ncbi:MAG: HAD family hydrolase, partial [Eubacteriales bacterium]
MKAVLFDLYETLITEWSGEKYTSAECAADLGVSTPVFREHWEALHDAMNTGALTYKQALCRIGMSAGVPLSEEDLAKVYARRLATKSACFAHIDPSVSAMLEALKRAGYRLGLCSNCSAEEVAALDSSILRPYFDAVVLSYEVGMAKPDPRIFLRTAEGLAVAPE